ncbi:Ras-related protein RABG3a [Zea mays]|uniref:Ras-related protein RABG3a n=1 Tax=Zea mays TaxID=4577 RepID=A0A1D6MIB0_MAIZE|nr:Ras-related protein RABG3a [Zea mays]
MWMGEDFSHLRSGEESIFKVVPTLRRRENSRSVDVLGLKTAFATFMVSLPFPQVPEKKAREWCASKGDIPYFETSAKEDHNVDTAFLCIARLALEHEHDQDIYFKTVVEQVPDTEQTSGCAC